MSTYLIDAVMRMRDQLTAPLEKAKSKMLENTRVIGKFSNALDKASKSFISLGNNLMKSITLPLATLGTTSVVSFAKFEGAMLGVKNVTQATGTELQELENLALSLSMSTSKSAIECANGIEYLGLAGWSTAEIMENYAEILRLSEATNIDLAIASDLVTDSLSAYGKSASFTTEYLNKLTLTSQNANASTQQLLESIVTSGGMAKNLGLDIDQLCATLGVLANRGIKGSEAGTSLNSIFVNLLGTTSTTRNALSALGVEVYDLQGKFIGWDNLLEQLSTSMASCTDEQRDMLAAALGGKTQLDTLLALLEGYVNEYADLKNKIADIYVYDELGNQLTILEKMQQDYQNSLIGQFETLKSEIGFIFIKIGNIINTNFGGSLAFVNEQVQRFISWCQSLSDEQKVSIVRWGTLALLIAPVSLLIGIVVSKIASGIKIFNDFNKSIKSAGGLMQLWNSPLGMLQLKILLVAAAIVLVCVAIYQMYKHWDTVKPILLFITSVVIALAIGFGILQLAGSITGIIIVLAIMTIVSVIFLLWKNWSKIWENIKTITSSVVDTIKTLLTNFIENIIGIFQTQIQFFYDVWNSITQGLIGFFEGIILIYNGIIDFITGIFTGNWQKTWEGIKSIFVGIWDSLVSVAKIPLNIIIDLINRAIRGINNIGNFKLPDWLGGKQLSLFSIPEIPKLYTGTMNWTGGPAMIHDKGPEIVDLPNGSRVYPNSKSIQMAYNDGKNSSENSRVMIEKLADTIIVREEADIDKITEKLLIKLENAAFNYA